MHQIIEKGAGDTNIKRIIFEPLGLVYKRRQTDYWPEIIQHVYITVT